MFRIESKINTTSADFKENVEHNKRLVTELKERMEQFETSITSIRDQRRTAEDLLTGDCKRMLSELESHVSELRERTRDYLQGIIRETIAENPSFREDIIHQAMGEAIPSVETEEFDDDL